MTPPFFDVRMKGFGSKAPVADVLALLDARIGSLDWEMVPAFESAGRVLAKSVVSIVDVPGFDRAAMDGYALCAADAVIGNAIDVIGDSLPAQPFPGPIRRGEGVRIMTGAPIPAGADAVLRAESALEKDGRVTVRQTVPPGKNIGRVGEDVKAGDEVLPSGRVLRPQDVGLLCSIGAAAVPGIRRPRVAILATGNELLPPGSVPAGTRIVDSNSPMLAALVRRDGGQCAATHYVPDRMEAVRAAVRDADADIVLVIGGSSVGTEDHAPRAVAELGQLAVHGIAIRPAAPTGIGFLSGKIVFLLPGNPVSCLCAYDLFAGRAIRRQGGRCPELPYRSVTATLGANIASAIGRLDYVRVKRDDGCVQPLTISGSSILRSTVVADGFVLIPPERESLAAGELVQVWQYD